MSSENTEAPSSPSAFEALGLKPELLAALTALGYEEPTPVQKATIPALLEGRDVLGQAATGTGKTAAFALPMLQRLEPGKCGPFQTSVLVLVPTRELAMQVAEAVFKYGKSLGVSVLAVYGGQPFGDQLRRLKRGVDVVIATPGRALDHLRRKTLQLDKVGMVVLDEADEMLDLGFAEDLETLLSAIPDKTQTALFSATLAPKIAAMAESHLNKPLRVKIAGESATAGSLPKIRQTAYVVPAAHKVLALTRVLEAEQPKSAIVFCRTRIGVEQLQEGLSNHDREVGALHGGMTQEQRDRVMKRFKSGALQLLVATDVAARGLHVEALSHVINFDLPTSPEVYVHRIGRTGRAGKDGIALAFVEPRESRMLVLIERLTKQKIELAKVPGTKELRSRQLERTTTRVAEALKTDALNEFLPLVEILGDPTRVAAAALASLHALLSPPSEADAVEIPSANARAPAGKESGRSRPMPLPRSAGGSSPRPFSERASPARPRADRPASEWSGSPDAERPARAHPERPDPTVVGPGTEALSAPRAASRPQKFGEGAPHRSAGSKFDKTAPPKFDRAGPARFDRAAPRERSPERKVRAGVRIFVSLGSEVGLRAGDIVGALANEGGLAAGEIGGIEIEPRRAFVEIPDAKVEQVLTALSGSTLRGRKFRIERDRQGPGYRPPLRK